MKAMHSSVRLRGFAFRSIALTRHNVKDESAFSRLHQGNKRYVPLRLTSKERTRIWGTLIFQPAGWKQIPHDKTVRNDKW